MDKMANEILKIAREMVGATTERSFKKIIGGTWDDLPKWLKKATVSNAVVELKGNKVIWKDGIWRRGNFGEIGGVLNIWEKGTWKDGIWMDGIWKNGTWEKGGWYDGIWHNGTRKGGNWWDGEWKNGTWENGDWFKGIWKNGTWKDGKWRDGDWQNGTWHNGVWWSEGMVGFENPDEGFIKTEPWFTRMTWKEYYNEQKKKAEDKLKKKKKKGKIASEVLKIAKVLVGTDLIPGGLAEGKDSGDFNKDSLSDGIKVELEHTDNEDIAREITMDHLTEDPNYYEKLKKVEAGTKHAANVARDLVSASIWEINPELLSKKPTHLFKGDLVKIFPSTGVSADNQITGEILTGRHKGKWTTVYLDKATPIKKVSKRILKKLLTAGAMVGSNADFISDLEKLRFRESGRKEWELRNRDAGYGDDEPDCGDYDDGDYEYDSCMDSFYENGEYKFDRWADPIIKDITKSSKKNRVRIDISTSSEYGMITVYLK